MRDYYINDKKIKIIPRTESFASEEKNNKLECLSLENLYKLLALQARPETYGLNFLPMVG